MSSKRMNEHRGRLSKMCKEIQRFMQRESGGRISTSLITSVRYVCTDYALKLFLHRNLDACQNFPQAFVFICQSICKILILPVCICLTLRVLCLWPAKVPTNGPCPSHLFNDSLSLFLPICSLFLSP
jgi:hypothetical protein